MKRITRILGIIAISAVIAIGFVGCPDNDPATVTLDPANVTINDGNLTQTINVSGTATGSVTLNASALPAEVNATVNGTTITVTGVRPTTENGSISGSYTVVVTRRGVKQNLVVVVNLTTTFDPSAPTVTLTPASVTINDGNLTQTVNVSGTATGSVTLNTSALPAGVTATVSGTTVTVKGVRPITEGASISGSYVVVVIRDGVNQNLTIVVNLTTIWTAGGSSAILEMVLIPAGTFTMGSNDNDYYDWIVPAHQVTLTSGFYMSKYQITQKQWETVMGTTVEEQDIYGYGLYGVGDNHPMYHVSWYDAIVFCNRLSILEGLSPAYSINDSTNPNVWGSVPYYDWDNDLFVGDTEPWDAVIIVAGSTGYRLPTEAQWEYACRAGTTTAYYWGDETDYDTVDQYAWYWENSDYSTHEVGLKLPNDFGLYDMSGNVWEWCWDWYEDYTDTAKTDPVGASSGSGRVLRGGSWDDSVEYLQSAYRNNFSPSFWYGNGGFRVLRP